MRSATRNATSALALVGAALLAPSMSDAQACHGTPQNGGIAYENGAHTFGTSHGARAVFTPGREAIGIDARVTETGSNETGFAGTMRFSFVRGFPVKVCPTLAAGFERRKWNPNPTTSLESLEFSGRAGVAAGYDYTIAKDFGIAPFLAVEYVHRFTQFNLQQPGFDVVDTGIDRGNVEATYGIMLRYWRVYAGFSAVHAFESGPPSARRLFVGFAF